MSAARYQASLLTPASCSEASLSDCTESFSQVSPPFDERSTSYVQVAAPGSTGMETCFVNLVEPGDKVFVDGQPIESGRVIVMRQRSR